MGSQALAFLQGEGAAWHQRNYGKPSLSSARIINAINRANIKAKELLEVGCGQGYLLAQLSSMLNCKLTGVDPAIDKSPLRIYKGIASDLTRFHNGQFDLLIYSFCLYLCDPEDHFRIAMEGNRVLQDGGHLIIYDFFAYSPYRNRYKHKEGLFSYKMNFADLWLKHPAYRLIHATNYGEGDNMEVCVVLKKDLANAFPVQA